MDPNWVSGPQAQALLDTLAWRRFAASDAAMVLEHQRSSPSPPPQQPQHQEQAQAYPQHTQPLVQQQKPVESVRRQQQIEDELMSLREASAARFLSLSPPVSSRETPRTYSAYSVLAAQAAEPSVVARHRLVVGTSWGRQRALSPVLRRHDDAFVELGLPPRGTARQLQLSPSRSDIQRSDGEEGVHGAAHVDMVTRADHHKHSQGSKDLVVANHDSSGARDGSDHALSESLDDAIAASHALIDRNDTQASIGRWGSPPPRRESKLQGESAFDQRQPGAATHMRAAVRQPPSWHPHHHHQQQQRGAFSIPAPVDPWDLTAADEAAAAAGSHAGEEGRDSTFESLMGRLGEMEAKQLIQQRRLANFQQVYGGGVVIPRTWGGGDGEVWAGAADLIEQRRSGRPDGPVR